MKQNNTLAEGLAWLQQNNISGYRLDFDELLMYRHFSHLLSTRPSGKVKHHMSGQYLAKTKGRGMEFDEARHYQPGDDVRTIDWRVTARTGKAHTKIFREEKDRPVFVFTDLLPSMRFGSQLLFKSVQACHLSALIAWKAKQNGDKIGGLILSEQSLTEAKPRSRQQAVLSWLNKLVINHNALPLPSTSTDALTQIQLEEKFAEGCAHLRRLAHPGSLVYVVSDFQHMSERAQQHLFQLQKHCEVVACCIHDPIEQSLPSNMTGLMPLTDGVSTKMVTSQAQLQQYQTAALALFKRRQSDITQYSIQWRNYSAGTPLADQL